MFINAVLCFIWVLWYLVPKLFGTLEFRTLGIWYFGLGRCLLFTNCGHQATVLDHVLDHPLVQDTSSAAVHDRGGARTWATSKELLRGSKQREASPTAQQDSWWQQTYPSWDSSPHMLCTWYFGTWYFGMAFCTWYFGIWVFGGTLVGSWYVVLGQRALRSTKCKSTKYQMSEYQAPKHQIQNTRVLNTKIPNTPKQIPPEGATGGMKSPLVYERLTEFKSIGCLAQKEKASSENAPGHRNTQNQHHKIRARGSF